MEGWEGRRGREQRSHSSRSIGVPEVIGNDKVGKMREGKSGTARRPSGFGTDGIRREVWKTILDTKKGGKSEETRV